MASYSPPFLPSRSASSQPLSSSRAASAATLRSQWVDLRSSVRRTESSTSRGDDGGGGNIALGGGAVAVNSRSSSQHYSAYLEGADSGPTSTIDDLLRETTELVYIPGAVEDPQDLPLGSHLLNATALGHDHTDTLVADTKELTDARVELVKLRAQVKQLEKEVASCRSTATATAHTHMQYQHLGHVLRARNAELESRNTDLEAQMAQHRGSMGKLNDLIMRQDAALKDLRATATRKIARAKRRVRSRSWLWWMPGGREGEGGRRG
jgi:hypothetical protein